MLFAQSAIDSVSKIGFTRSVIVLIIVGVAANYDSRTRRIPNFLTYSGAVLGILFGLVAGWSISSSWAGLANSLTGFAACFGLMMILWIFGGTGGGDVKLAALIGAFLGWKLGVSVLLWAHMLGSVIALIWISKKYGIRKTGSAVLGLFARIARYLPFSQFAWLRYRVNEDDILRTRIPMGMAFGFATLITIGGGQLL